MIVAVNKMDLVDYAEERFDEVVREVLELGAAIGLHEIEFIPISALKGDNVVEPSANMPWYAGPPLLERLETIPVEPPAVHGARLPVQLVLRGEGGARWAAGRLAAGTLKAGDEVVVLPSGIAHAHRRGARRRRRRRGRRGAAERVGAARGRGRPRARRADRRRRGRAGAGARAHGDRLLARRPPGPRAATASRSSTARAPFRPGSTAIDGRIDFETLEWPAADELRLNDIAHVKLRLGGEIAADAYAQCHATGAFILVDESTHDTVAAGMVS